MAYTYHPYTGDYAQYGQQPQFNWFDFLYGGQPGSDGTVPPSGAPSSGGGGGAAPAGAGGSGAVPSGALGLLGNRDNQGSGAPGGPMSGGPVMPTGHTTSPWAGTDPLHPTTGGALLGIANMLDPTPGNLLSEAAQFGYDPEAYMDTAPMTVPGVGTIATQPGIMQGFMSSIPMGGAIANVMGKMTANKLADIANATHAGTEGYGMGNYKDMYGRTRMAGISPGPFDTGSVMTSPAGPVQFGWRGVHQIMNDLQQQNKGNGAARTHPSGSTSAPSQSAMSHGRAGMNQRGVERGGGDPGDRGGNRNDLGGRHDPNRPEKMARGGQVGALAALGRGDDDSLAHVAKGELMLPPEFQRRHPGAMDLIHRAMSEEGMNPRDYRAGDVIDVNPETGLPEYGFWKTIEKTLLPAAAGAATSYLTGSDILGGLAAGVGSKLMGGDWGTALGVGALTGLGSAGLGLSGEGPGMLGELFGGAAPAAGGFNGHGADLSMGDSGGGGGFLSGIGNWIGDNPEATALGGAAALSLLGGLGGDDEPKSGDSDYVNPGNDPEFAEQAKKGWTLDREQTAPSDDFNWYQYGQMPSYMFFDNVNADVVPNMKEGGALSASVQAGNKSALAILGSVPRGQGGGQDDVVDAKLAHGEHVLDADLVSALGDGDNDEGHRKIEAMKKKIRKHKRSAPVDRIPPRAKPALEYLAGVN